MSTLGSCPDTVYHCFFFRRVALRNSPSAENGDSSASSSLRPPLPPSCDHPQCAHAHQLLLLNSRHHSSSPPIPSAYVGLGSLWFPELLGLEPLPMTASQQLRSNSSTTAVCSGGADSCDCCRQLAQPPPSYSKLFLEDSPPSYVDAVTTAAGPEQQLLSAAEALCPPEVESAVGEPRNAGPCATKGS